MSRTSRLRALPAALAAAILLLGAGSAQAAWDQGKVTALSEKLEQEMDALYRELGKLPPDLTFSQRRAQYQLRDDLRLLRNNCRHFSAELKQGKDKEETLPVFKRIRTLRRNAEENARKTTIQDSTMERMLAVGAVILQIEPYYRDEPSEGGE